MMPTSTPKQQPAETGDKQQEAIVAGFGIFVFHVIHGFAQRLLFEPDGIGADGINHPPELGVGRYANPVSQSKNPLTICPAMAGMMSFSSGRVVKITSANFPPPGSSTSAASCRAVLMSPALDQSFAPAGSAAPT